TGPTVQVPVTGTQHVNGSPGLWLIVMGAAVMIAVTFLIQAHLTAAIVTLVSALIGFGSLLNAWQSFEASRSPFIRVDYEPGLWLSIIAMLGAIAAGILGL